MSGGDRRISEPSIVSHTEGHLSYRYETSIFWFSNYETSIKQRQRFVREPYIPRCLPIQYTCPKNDEILG